MALQAATLAATWPTWGPRETPPLLPLIPLPQLAAGPLLLGALLLVGLRPRLGLPAYATLLAAAMVADQTRMQPHMLSLFYLTCGTMGSSAGVLVARASLVSLWFFAGVHKLTSPSFFASTAPWLAEAVIPGAPRRWSLLLGIGVGAGEMLLAAGCLLPACRRGTAWAIPIFHGLALLLLSPLVLDWNREVWPWNVALACAGPALVAPWRGRLLGEAWAQSAAWGRWAAVALLVLPIGYWFGVVDALLAHCLYSDNLPRAFLCTPDSRRDLRLVCEELGVQIPPAHRHFEPLFLGVGKAGMWMEVEDPRWIARRRGDARRTVRWWDLLPSTGSIAAPRIAAPAAPESRAPPGSSAP